MTIKNFLKKLIKNSTMCNKIAKICNEYPYSTRYYGQNAEDAIASSFFPQGYPGFYVDIGAHHPVKYSNTYLLYQSGWHGINIDPLPGSMLLFNEMRPLDINLEVCVFDSEQIVKYYSFDEPAYNTLSSERAEEVVSKNYAQLQRVEDIKAEPLWSIFSRNIPVGQCIDLMTVDVETMELQVLKTNDWEKYVPKLIVIESLITQRKDIFSVMHDPVVSFLLEKNYQVVGKAVNTVYLRHALFDRP